MLVVTGASGFLGRYVVACALARGLDVTAVSRRKISVLPGVINLRLESYESLPNPMVPSVLVHLAGEPVVARVNGWNDERLDYELRNFQKIARKRWRGIVLASSAVVYGDSKSSQRTEAEQILAERGYCSLKLAQESLAVSFGGVALRFANLYGEGMSSENVVSDVMRQLDGSSPIEMRTITPIRDFLYVADAADAIIRAAQVQAKGILNIGTGIGTSIAGLVETAVDIAGLERKELREITPVEGINCLVLDPSLAMQKIGWEAKTSLRLGLKKMITSQKAVRLG